jgi:hypothetical protein
MSLLPLSAYSSHHLEIELTPSANAEGVTFLFKP